LKILNSSISPSLAFNSLVRGSSVNNLDIPPANYLVSPYRLGMVEVVRRVLELGYSGELNRVQVPHNDCRPLFQVTTPLFCTSFKLELLRPCDTVLAIYDHELVVLDLIPILGL
jgi:hypothetical protein